MAGIKISALPVVASALTTDFFPVVQGGVTSQETISQVQTLFGYSSGILLGASGGTGVSNSGKTITIGGNVTFSGAFTFTGTLTGNTSVTFPTSGTLATTTGTIANATNIATTQVSNNANYFPLMVASSTNSNQPCDLSTGWTFNPSNNTSVLSALGVSSIATFTPSTTIESATQAGANTITSTAYVTSATSGARFVGQHARNTFAAPAALANNDIIVTFGAQGYGTTAFSASTVAYLKMFAAEAWSDTAQGTRITIATTPNTTITPVDAITISNAGVVAFPVAPLGLTSGGTNASLTASNGAIPYSTATSFAFLAAGSSGQLFQSGGAGAPNWTTATYPSTATNTARILRADGTNWAQTTSTFADTYGASTILYANGANNVAGLATANSSVLVTTSTGVPVQSGTLTNGQMIIGSTGATPVVGTIAGGTGISVSTGAGTLTITNSAGGITWNDVTTNTLMVANNGYVVTSGGGTMTIPATCAVGSLFWIAGSSAGGWILQANTGQVIHFGSATTSSAGSLGAVNRWDSVLIVCVTANTTFSVLSSIGNLVVS